MKKAFIIVAAFSLITVNTFAQSTINWTAWGRGVFTPIAFDGANSSVSAATTTWGGQDVPRLGFKLDARSENNTIGIIAEFEWNEWTSASDLVGENAKIWVRPFPFLKLTVGKFNEDDLRGTIGTTEFNSWLTWSGGRDEDFIFTRFQAPMGAHLAFIPTEDLFKGVLKGLYIEAALGSSIGGGRANRNLFEQEAKDVYKSIQVGAGYKIPDIGFARAQFIGNNRNELRLDDHRTMSGKRLMQGLDSFNFMEEYRDADVIEAAFSFTRVENLHIDVGIRYPLPYTTDAKFTIYPVLYPISDPVQSTNSKDVNVKLPLTASLAATYKVKDFNVLARFDFASSGTIEEKDIRIYTIAPTFGFWLCPAYRFSSFFRTGIDFGISMHLKDQREYPIDTKTNLIGSDYSDIGFGPWLELNVGDGTVKTGVMVMLPSSPRYILGPSTELKWIRSFSGKPVISVPISVTYNL